MDLNNIQVSDLKDKLLQFADKKTLIKFGIGFGSMILFLLIYYIALNPIVKSKKAMLDDKLDVIATDHAPHTLNEKNNTYFKAPSGGPLVQHALPVMLEFFSSKKIKLEKIVEKMCHNPAICFKIKNRGFIRKGYYADLVLVNLKKPWKVKKSNILYKCGWSPFEGQTFNSNITHTFINGHLAYKNGKFNEEKKGMRLKFSR